MINKIKKVSKYYNSLLTFYYIDSKNSITSDIIQSGVEAPAVIPIDL